MIQLVEPDETRLIRAIDEQFLAALKAKMMADPSAPGVPPIAVNCVSVKVRLYDQYILNVHLTYKYVHANACLNRITMSMHGCIIYIHAYIYRSLKALKHD